MVCNALEINCVLIFIIEWEKNLGPWRSCKGPMVFGQNSGRRQQVLAFGTLNLWTKREGRDFGPSGRARWFSPGSLHSWLRSWVSSSDGDTWAQESCGRQSESVSFETCIVTDVNRKCKSTASADIFIKINF